MPTNPLTEKSQKTGDEIHAVAFDLDGLMFNTEDLYDQVADGVLQKRGHQFTRELKLKMMGLPGPRAIEVMIEFCSLTDSVGELMEECHSWIMELLPGHLQPMPGLLELLELIEEAALPKSIATSSMREFAHRALDLSGLLDRFEFVLTAEDVVRGKPHPDIYIDSADRHRVATGNLLVLEDSILGSRAASSAGAITIAIPGHHSMSEDFGHATFRFSSLAEPCLRAMVKNRQVH